MLTHTVDLLLQHRAPVQLGFGVAQLLDTNLELGIMYATCANESMSTAQLFFSLELNHHSPFGNSQFVSPHLALQQLQEPQQLQEALQLQQPQL